MRQEAIEAIDRLKPYKGGNEPLWKIHELNNIDKHRFLFTVGNDLLFTGNGFDGGFWFKASNPIFEGIIEGIAGPIPNQDFKFEVDKTFDETKILKSQALVPTLHQLVDFVDNLVSSFKRFLE